MPLKSYMHSCMCLLESIGTNNHFLKAKKKETQGAFIRFLNITLYCSNHIQMNSYYSHAYLNFDNKRCQKFIGLRMEPSSGGFSVILYFFR